MPDPIVVNASKIPETKLPASYVYDIPTVAGQEIELVDISSVTGVEPVQLRAHADAECGGAAYSTGGMKVDDSYHGIVITKGGKYVRK